LEREKYFTTEDTEDTEEELSAFTTKDTKVQEGKSKASTRRNSWDIFGGAAAEEPLPQRTLRIQRNS
jgi:hypothetical protein